MSLYLSGAERCDLRNSPRCLIFAVFIVVAAIGPSSYAQDTSQKPPASATPTASDPKEAAKSAAAASTDPRQAKIAADTEKLLKLTQELKFEVAKSTKDTLSVTVVRKAEEVEKLARTLREELSKSH